MAAQVTKKQILNAYDKVYSIPYCMAQSILSRETPRFYTCGVYGWNADIYTFGNVAIATGYRPFGESNEKSFEIIRKLERKAYASNHSGKRRSYVGKLLAELGKVC